MILSQQPMDDKNYNKWKTNIFIVSEYENIKFVLTTSKLKEPVVDASDQI